ncbi:hypothetical protein [Motilimonas sp. E26]|uniref:hypothetical protein n=1 Tax=Motilimonas sp. E26 TaxID=2865674 RepID=UPI001E5A6ACB|nr:hypothetical protein [Motilimonas sp. E26]MCE0558995.1 hypothetical protein [Motilimonas sp. E26]
MKSLTESWVVDSDKMCIRDTSGARVYREFDYGSNEHTWKYENASKTKALDGLRYFYHTEGVFLLKALRTRFNMSNPEVCLMINSEVEREKKVKNNASPTNFDCDDLAMIILNELPTREISVAELEGILNGNEYCEPWIPSFLRTALSRKK